MAKSKINNSVLLHGFLNIGDEESTITEVIKKKNDEIELTYDLNSILKKFNNKEVVISIRETKELESN